MSESIKNFLKPPYYALENDKQLKLSIQMISDHKQKGGLHGHALAVAQAVHSIALAIFINIPYYLALGSKNFFLNCVHLHLELTVLGNYNAAMQNLIYSVIATVYVVMGIFISPVLDGFKIGESQSDDPSIPLGLIIEDQSETRIPTPSLEERSFTSISSIQIPVASNQVYSFSPPNYVKEESQSDNSSSSGSSMPSVEDQAESKESIQSFTSSNKPSYSSIPPNTPSVQNYVKEESLRTFSNISLDSSIQNEMRNEHDSVSSQYYPNQASSILTPSININDDLISGDWAVIPNVESFAIKSTNIRTRDMIGAYGINLERQAYRTALNEYIRILKDDFDIDLNERLTIIGKWLRNPVYQNNSIVNALYRTLFYLTKPVACDDKGPIYTHAKEQYEKYVISLREIIATEQYQSIRQDPNPNGDLKECLTLTRALCEARFRSENHELLRSLLQLHEDEYDRLNPEREEIPAVNRENFARVVMAKNQKVTEAPVSMKVSSTQKSCRMLQGAIGYEDFLTTDIPFLRGEQIFVNDQGEERSFCYMRHPTPHIEGSPAWIVLGAMSRMSGLGHIESGETIAPEFEGMLEAIAQREESYLIQSHQRFNDIRVENEDSRSKSLYRLQRSHKNFHVVFQAVEGNLFDRKGSYAEITEFKELKEAIKASFYDKKSPNCLPRCLKKNKEYRDSIIDNILDQVHQTLFGGRSDISFDGRDPTKPGADYPNHEWQAFILAFYILQGDDLKFRLPNVKYFCTNCKNFFDRGGNRAMAEDRLHQEMSEKEVIREDLEATIVNLIPVPLQSKGKAVIEERLKPGLALAEILAKLSLEDRQRLQGIHFGGYKPERFEVSKKEQRAVPLIEDVCTLQEMQEVLRALQGKSYYIVDNSIIQKNWDLYQEKDRDLLFTQLNKDLKRFIVQINGTLYDAKDSNNDAGAIFDHLKACRISEDATALKAMAQMQQSILLDPFSGLMKAFQHDKLELHVTDSPEKSIIDVITTGDSIEIKAQNSLLYKTTNPKSSYFRKSPIAVFNTKVLATIPKDGSASNSHWTWEVAEVS